MFIFSKKVAFYLKQVIEQRNIAYRTALELIFREEYLNAADTDLVIKKLR